MREFIAIITRVSSDGPRQPSSLLVSSALEPSGKQTSSFARRHGNETATTTQRKEATCQVIAVQSTDGHVFELECQRRAPLARGGSVPMTGSPNSPSQTRPVPTRLAGARASSLVGRSKRRAQGAALHAREQFGYACSAHKEARSATRHLKASAKPRRKIERGVDDAHRLALVQHPSLLLGCPFP